MVSSCSIRPKRLLLIVTGSIAAIKTPELLKAFHQKNIDVEIVLTQAAQEFISKTTLSALTGKKCHTELFDKHDDPMQHIRLAKYPDLVLICPATAHIIATYSCGLAGDLAQSILLATTAPVAVAPAMNPHMWEKETTQRNISLLRSRKITVIPPQFGRAACGDIGIGHLAEPEQIVATAEKILCPPAQTLPLKDLKILVTAGPTREFIDPIRYLSNASSGRQGYAIAAILAQKGATVTLISGPCDLTPPANVTVFACQTACEMQNLVVSQSPYDVAICTAAVSDYRPAQTAQHKLKKAPNPNIKNLELIPNPDILKNLGNSRHHRPKLVVGFSAETRNLFENACEKRKRKNCDWIVANNVSKPHFPMGSHDNQVMFITRKAHEQWPVMDKTAIAEKLSDKIEAWHQNISKKLR